MDTSRILTEIKERLQAHHGNRLRGVILYGSEARGDTTPESDIDVLVLLEDPVDYGHDLDTNLEALYPLAEKWSRRISAKPVSAEAYKKLDCPLHREAHREGIAA